VRPEGLHVFNTKKFGKKGPVIPIKLVPLLGSAKENKKNLKQKQMLNYIICA